MLAERASAAVVHDHCLEAECSVGQKKRATLRSDCADGRVCTAPNDAAGSTCQHEQFSLKAQRGTLPRKGAQSLDGSSVDESSRETP